MSVVEVGTVYKSVCCRFLVSEDVVVGGESWGACERGEEG